MAIPMLTTFVLQLQEQGKLSLDDTLSKWYPDYPNADKVTLRMLSSVTSGLSRLHPGEPAVPGCAARGAVPPVDRRRLLHYAFALPVVCDPGTCFHYAHTNFILLGRVIEQVTRKSVTELMQQRFLDKLGIPETKITK